MVRWAKNAGGAWRAQVTPTLVDARSGTTKWTGDPQVVTPTDPFTAQGAIAADVARTIEIQLRPNDAAEFRRRATSNPEALAAYTRAVRFIDDVGREATDPARVARALEDLKLAVSLDSTYADAWAMLAATEPEGTPDSHRALAHAQALAPDHPVVLALTAVERLYYQHDTVGVDALLYRAAANARNDVRALTLASTVLAVRGHPDTAFALLERATTLNPRSAPAHEMARCARPRTASLERG